MATASIGGLASGLDTATIVEQLMQLEAIPQTKLRYQVSAEQSKATALQQINTALTTLASAAKGLAEASATSGTWAKITTTSSDPAFTATATTTAEPVSLSVTVGKLAAAASTTIAGVTPTASSTYTITAAGSPVTFTTDATPTLAEMATAINATSATTNLRATVVHGSDGDVLQVASTTTGAASGFTISDGTQTFTGAGGADGEITVNGVIVRSESNTFKGVVDGIDITVAATAAVGAASTITVARDGSGRSNAVKALVDNVNSVLSMIGTQSSTNVDRTKSGVLAGDGTARRVTAELTAALYPDGNVSMAQFGLQVDRSGRFTLDAEKFAAAYTADPEAVTAAFTGADGFAGRIRAAAQTASDKYDGYVTSAITGRNDSVKRLNASIMAWDDRLEMRRQTLERTYSALETALSRLNSQSSWLASQISSLSGSSQ